MKIEISNTDRLIHAVQLRKKELKETTKQSVSAIAVNTLKSLRANTLVANPNKNKITVTKSSLTAKCVEEGKIMIFNSSGQHVRVPHKLVMSASLNKGKKFSLFHVKNQISPQIVKEYYVVSNNISQVKKEAKLFVKAMAGYHKGLARLSLGLCMNLIANQSIEDATNSHTKNVANNCARVEINETGFDSGEVSIKIHDKIEYATLALKNGNGYVDTALNLAINKVLGMIASKMKKDGRIDESLAVQNMILQVI